MTTISKDAKLVTFINAIEDYEAMRKDPTPLPYLREALTIAKFEPGRYEVVESYLPDRRGPEGADQRHP